MYSQSEYLPNPYNHPIHYYHFDSHLQCIRNHLTTIQKTNPNNIPIHILTIIYTSIFLNYHIHSYIFFILTDSVFEIIWLLSKQKKTNPNNIHIHILTILYTILYTSIFLNYHIHSYIFFILTDSVFEIIWLLSKQKKTNPNNIHIHIHPNKS